MDIRMLGPLEVTDDGRRLEIGGPKQRALLALLAIDANQVVSIERLIDELWGESPPPSALGTLRSQVARLRKALEPERPPRAEPAILVSHSNGYELRIDPSNIDARRFEMAVVEAKTDSESGDPLRWASRLRSALAEWRGPALSDLADYEFARIEATRLEGLRLAAVEDRLEADLQAGRAGEIVAELEALVESHPYREGLWRRLMLALYQTGRQADALRAYQTARQRLGEELGIEPGPELAALEERILLHDEALAPVTPSRGGLHNFPTERTTFIGRDRELLEIADLLSESRCVTITGMGGAGKTRLALRLAVVVVEAFPDGVYLVELAPISDPGLVLAQVGDALGVLEGGCEPVQSLDDALTTYLRGKRVLIVLDNSEHVLDTTAGLVERLLDDCHALTLLVTSRQRLGVAGETVYRLLPLSLPPVIGEDAGLEGYEAVRLFEARARSARSDFHLTAENIGPVVEICRRLDGIPLAIELAAARVSVLSPAQIADRLRDSIGLLSRGPGKDPRHQTLVATMEWSYRLLTEPEKKLLSRLSVFSGSWDIDALEAVVAPEGIGGEDGFELLAALVDKSLVVVEDRAGRATYRLLDTVRQYAAERLAEAGDTTAVERRHGEWMLDLVRAGTEGVRGHDQLDWLDRFDLLGEEFETAAQRMLRAGDLETTAELISGLGWHWYMSGNWKGARRWVDICVEAGLEGPALARVTYKVLGIDVLRGYFRDVPIRIMAAREVCREAGDVFGAAWSTMLVGIASQVDDLDLYVRLLDEARAEMERLGHEWGATVARMWHGVALTDVGDDQRGTELLRRSSEAFLRLGDAWSAAESMFWIGQTAYQRGDYDAAEAGFRESITLAHRSRNPVYEAHAQSGLSNVLFYRDDVDEIEESLLRAREFFLRIGDDFCSIATIGRLGRVALLRHDYDEAQRYLVQALQASDAMGNHTGVAIFLVRLAAAAAAQGDAVRAGRLLGAFEGVAEETPLPPMCRDEFSTTLEEAGAMIGGESFDTAFTEGREMALEEAVELASSAAPLPVAAEVGAGASQRVPEPVLAAGPGLQIVLFTDIEGSTRLADLLGDTRAQELRRTHDSVTRRVLAEHGGVEIKHTGDGFMASFLSVIDAIECALVLQRSFAEHNRTHPATPIRIRAGLNAGEPVAEDGDLFGTIVNLAARICDTAAADQILVSNVVRELAVGKDFAFVEVGDVELKGISGASSLFEVVWHDSALVG